MKSTGLDEKLSALPVRRVLLPIRVGIEPMEGLLVATLNGDPEFEALEPQLFDDPINGKGIRVLRYRKDGSVDVYWQPGVKVDPATFTVGAGLRDFEETIIEPSRFQIGGRAIDVDLAFTDAQGRRVELRIHEDFHGKRGFPLLAPVGADIEKPTQLFLVFMPGIDLLRRSGSEVTASIGDRAERMASLPILLHGHRVWFVRYAAKPIIGTLNPPVSRPAGFELSVPGSIEAGGMTVVVDGEGTIARISAGQGPCRADVDFLPGFPNLLDFADGASIRGRWSIFLSGVGITGGSYSASRTGNRVAISLGVTENWKPSGLPLSMKILVRVMGKFRTWPTTYRWRGIVELGDSPAMSGAWERVGRR